MSVDDGRFLHADMPGMDPQSLAASERLFDDLTRQVQPHGSRPGHALKDEAFASKDAGAQTLLKHDVETDCAFGAEEGFLAADDRLTRCKLFRE